MALLVAARAPWVWAAVSAWVPITDLARWYEECKKRGLKYAEDMAAACGGAPGDGEAIARQYRLRSPLPVLRQAAGVPVDLNAGIHDGHTGSVPISHTLRAFNVLARANGMPEKALSSRQIDWFLQRQSVPLELAGEREADPDYLGRAVLFRRSAQAVRVTIFEGGHEGIPRAACNWLAGHRKNSRRF